MKDLKKVSDYIVKVKFDGWEICEYVGNGDEDTTFIIPDELEGKPVYAISGEFQLSRKISKVIISDGIEEIEDGAFNKCNFKSIHIGASLHSISFLQRLTFFNEITVSPENEYFEVFEKNLYSRRSPSLLLYIDGQIRGGIETIESYSIYFKSIDVLEIPYECAEIAKFGILGCTIGKLIIPNTVMIINQWAIGNNFIDMIEFPDYGGTLVVDTYGIIHTEADSMVVCGNTTFAEVAISHSHIRKLVLYAGRYEPNWFHQDKSTKEIVVDFKEILPPSGNKSKLIPNGPPIDERTVYYEGELIEENWTEKRFW